LTELQPHIAVLGGGVAGLAAAYRLLQLRPEWRVIVLEEGDQPGGLASSWKLGKFTADLGPHRIYTELPEIKKLLPELIDQGEMLTVERRSEMLLDGKYITYPIQPGEMLSKFGPAKVAGLAAGVARGKARALTGKHPVNYEDAMIRAFGTSAYRMIIGPYTEKVWKIAPADLSEDVARVRVSAGNATRLMSQWLKGGQESGEKRPTSLKQFAYIRGGVQGLVDTLTRKVEDAGGNILTNCIVTGLTGEPGRVRQVITHRCAPPIAVDAVISTVPIPDLTEMVSTGGLSTGDGAVAMETAQSLEYVGLMLVAVMINRDQVSPNSWIYFPGHDLIFNRAYEPGNFDPSMKPQGQSMLVFEITARWDSDIWRKSNDEIIRQTIADSLKTNLFTAEDINDAAALRVAHAYPLYTRDYRLKLQRLYDYLRPVSNLITTGRQGLFNHNNMDHSMLMGMRAAEALTEKSAPAQTWYSNLDQFAHFRIVD